MEEASCTGSPRAASSCRELHSGPGAGFLALWMAAEGTQSGLLSPSRSMWATGCIKLSVLHGKTAKQEKTQSHPLEPLPYHPSATRAPATGLVGWQGGGLRHPRLLDLCKGTGLGEHFSAQRRALQ